MADESFDFGTSNGFGKTKYDWAELLDGKVHFVPTDGVNEKGEKKAKHFDYQCRKMTKTFVLEKKLPHGTSCKVKPYKTDKSGKKVQCTKEEREGFAVQALRPKVAPAK